jgi:hypothetical protein
LQHVVGRQLDALHDAVRGLVRVGRGQPTTSSPGDTEPSAERGARGACRVLRLGHVADGKSAKLRRAAGDALLLHDVDVGIELGLPTSSRGSRGCARKGKSSAPRPGYVFVVPFTATRFEVERAAGKRTCRRARG